MHMFLKCSNVAQDTCAVGFVLNMTPSQTVSAVLPANPPAVEWCCYTGKYTKYLGVTRKLQHW